MNTNKSQAEQLPQDAVMQRIFLVDNIKMDQELFKKKAILFSEHLISTFGFEMLNKLSLFQPCYGEFWQLKYSE